MNPGSPAQPTDKGPREGPVRRIGWILAALVALALGLRLLGFTDPWSGRGADFHALFGAFATGGPARNFAEHGLGESLGMPYDWRIEYADGQIDHGWYAHHPPLYMWLAGLSLTVFGPEPWALRLLSLLGSMFAVVAVGLFVRELWGTRAAIAAALLAATLPLGWRTGMLPWTEAPIAATIALAAREQLRFVRGAPRGALVRAALWLLFGALLDWPAHFAFAALFFHLLLFARPQLRRERAVGALLLYPLLAFAALGSHALHMALSMGAEAARGDTHGTLGGVMTLGVPLSEFLRLQGLYLVRYHTEAGLLLVGLGALSLLSHALRRKEQRAEMALVGALLVPGVLYVGLFPGRSVNHDFFFLVSLPFVVAAGAAGYRVLAGAGRGARAALALAVLVFVCAFGAYRGVQHWLSMRSFELGRLVEEPWLQAVIEDPDAVVLTHLGRGMFLPFYSRAALVHSVDTRESFEHWRQQLNLRTQPHRGIYFLADLNTLLLLPDGPALAQALAERGSLTRHDTAPGGPMALLDLRDPSGEAR